MYPFNRRLPVRTHRAAAFAAALIAALVTAAIAVQAQVPGPNVNMVSGRSLPDGDPFLQRQNEPSGALSTRNPLHILAGANDYRTVDLPGLPDGEETGDAWLGVYKSFDGGQSWRSTLIPGYPQDKSADGLSSPLHAYQAGADPTVRAGTNGLFYYSGIAFNRGTNGLGVIFLSRFIDDNNAPGQDSIRFLGTSVIASGTKNKFIDKPYMVVDVPRPGANVCSIPTPGGSTTQTIRAGTIYVSYVVFDGNEKNLHSKVMLTRSTDCGVTWSKPSKVSEGPAINQGVALTIDPLSGEVYLAWRQFLDKTHPSTTKDAVLIARSNDVFHKDDRDQKAYREPMQFSQPVMLANGIQPFDQGDSRTTFRTNSYPTMTADATGRVYVAWTERGFGPPSNIPPTNPNVLNSDARVVMMTSKNGQQWTAKTPIEPTPLNGHQIMPVLTTVAGKITAVYYDLREDVAGVFGQYVDDGNSTVKRHTLDVRVLQAKASDTPVFDPSVQVSRYLAGSLPGEKGQDKVRQLQFNVPNLPLYRLGTTPFIGDFLDIAGQTFVQNATGSWTFNVAPGGPSSLHAFWTDNRDVRPPKNKDWTKYTPPTSLFTTVKCEAGTTGMRNSNIYTSLVTPGLRVGSPSNARRLDPTAQRSFVVFAQNNTAVLKRFRMRIANQPAGGRASFMQFDALTEVDVNTPARSTGSRTVFVTSSDPTAKITVDVVEVEVPLTGQTQPPEVTNGLRGSIALNPDVTNPDVTNPDVTNAELLNPDVTNPDVTNPDVTNPDVTNPDVTNPDVTNVVVANPDVTNPDVTNPDVTNPDVTNPDVTNAGMADGIKNGATPIDATWTVTNKGTVAGSFAVKPFIAKNAPGGTKQQLILHKSYQTPVTVGDDCAIKTVTQLVLVSNITDPGKLQNNPSLDPADESNGTIWLEPGQSAKVTLRVMPPVGTVLVTRTVTQSNGTTATVLVDPRFDPSRDVAPVIQQVVVPLADVQAGTTTPPPPTIPLVVDTTTLAAGVTTQAYSQQLVATGGVGSRTWAIVPSSDANVGLRPLPPGLALASATGRITGVPTAAGSYPFTVQATDSDTPQHVNKKDLTISIAPFALTQSVTTPEDQAGDVTLGAAGLDNSQIVFTVTQPPAHGTLSGSGAGRTYTPNADFNGADSFQFTADAFGLTSPAATVSIDVTPVNDAPSFTANPVPASAEDAGPQSVAGTLTNFSPGPQDESAQTLVAYSVLGNTNLTLFSTPPAFDNAGTLSYRAAANANGSATITVTAKDSGGTASFGVDTSTPRTVTITVTPVNDAPTVAQPIAPVEVNEDALDTTIDLSQTFTDSDSATNFDVLSLSVPFNSNPALVTATLDAATQTLTLHYLANQNGSASITVRATDAAGAFVDEVLAVTVAPVNDPPVANTDNATIFEDQAIGIDVLANDTSGADTGETLRVLSVTQSVNGFALLCYPAPSGLMAWWSGDDTANDMAGTNHGTPAGGATFAPGKVGSAFSFNGVDGVVTTPLTVSYSGGATFDTWIRTTANTGTVVTDAGGTTALSGMGLFVEPGGLISLFGSKGTQGVPNFQVIGPAVNDGTYHHVAGSWTGDTTAGGVKLYVDGALVGSATALSAIAAGTTPISIGWSSVDTTHAPFNGQIDEVHVFSRALSARDVQETFQVGAAGFCKTAPAGSSTGTASGTWTGTVLSSTGNGDQAYVFLQQSGTQLTGTTVDGSDVIAGTLSNEAAGVQTYDVTITETVPGAQCSPSTASGTFSIDTINNTLTGSLLRPHTVDCALNVTETVSLRRATDVATGVIYFPRDHFNGSDSFIYTVGDGHGGTATATVNVTVTPVNDPPSFTIPVTQVGNTGQPADTTHAFVLEDAGLQTIPNFVTNITAGPTSDELSQTVSFLLTVGGNAGLFAGGQPPQIDSNGTLTFRSGPNLNSNFGSAFISVRATDSGGTANGGVDTSFPRNFTIIVTPVNDPPTFTLSSTVVTRNEDAGGQPPSSGFATVTSKGAPNEGGQSVAFIVTNDNNALFSSQPAIFQNGAISFSSAFNAYGSATVTVRAKDDSGTANGGSDTSAPQTFTITIHPVNDQPNFNSGQGQTVLNNAGPQTVPNWATNIVLGPTNSGPTSETNGSCVPLVPSVCQQTGSFIVTNTNNTAALFSVQPSISSTTSSNPGTLTYTPAPGASGNANFNVQLQDSGDGTAPNSNTSPIRSFSIFVQRPLAITTTSPLPPATTGQNYNAALNASNGNGGVTWSLAQGSNPLPPGLTLTGNQITGVPTRTGNVTFTVQATDFSTPAQVVTAPLVVSVSAADQQSFGDGATNTLPIDPTHRVSQVVTAGASGPLTVLTFPTLSCSINPITITIEGVSAITGMPDDANVLAGPWSTTITGTYQQIALPSPLFFAVDQRFALVLSSTGACQVTNSSASDTYSGGAAFTSSSPWTSAIGIGDMQFRTQMQNGDLIAMLRNHGQVRTIGISGGRILIIGADGTAEVFDPTTRTSVATGPMIAKRQDAAAVLLSNGNVLVTGGADFPPCPPAPAQCLPGVYNASSEIYDPVANTWSAGAQMSATRAFHTATVLADNRVLVAGGSPTPISGSFNPPNQSTDVFTADGSSAIPGPTMVQGRQGHQATLLTTGQLLVTGGFSNGAFPFKSAEIVDAALTGFVATGEMVTPRANHTATLLSDGTVLMAGGQTTNGPQTMASTYEIFAPASNPEAGAFGPAGTMVEPRFWHTATLINGSVLLTGGVRSTNFSNNFAPWAAAELWVPGSGPGSGPRGMPSLIVTRYHHGAVPIAGGLIAIAGGWSPGAQSGMSIELYDPSGPAIQNPQFPDGSTSSSYPTTALLGTGGTGPYTFTLVEPAHVPAGSTLPPGLAFSGGTISDSGQPKTSGTYLFVVQITDSSAPTARTAYQTVRIRINPLDITTTGVPNAFVGYPYSATLASTDGGGSPRIWSRVAGSLPDGLSLSDTGVISGTPTSQSGFSNFAVQVADSVGQTATRGFGLAVNSAPPPFAGNDGYFTNEDAVLTINAPGVLANDNDQAVGQGGLTAVLVSGTTNGTLTLNANGSFAYTPNANFNGVDSFTYSAKDVAQQSNLATVNINVNAVNDPPTAGNDTAATAEDTTLSFQAANLIANDSPGPNEANQTLTVSEVRPTADTFGQVFLNAGVVTFVPAPDSNGPAGFDYVVWDDGTTNGAADPRSAAGHVFVTVTEVNDPPVATGDSKSTGLNVPLSFLAGDLTANDSPGPANENAQTLTVTTVTASEATHGTVTLANGTVVYSPAQDYSGPATFAYEVCDNGTTNGAPDQKCATGAVAVTVFAKAFETNLGVLIAKCDDCSATVTLPFVFPFFGIQYGSVSANNNGNLTFNGADPTFAETLGSFSSRRRIAPFWDDLISDAADGIGSPADAGLYYNGNLPGRAVFTWYKEREFGTGGSTTVQAILYSDGHIQFAYNGVTSRDGIIGVTPGGAVPLVQVNYTFTPFSIGPFTAAAEQFQVAHPNGTTDPRGAGATTGAENPFDLDHAFLIWEPTPSLGFGVSDDPPPAVIAWGRVTGTAFGPAGLLVNQMVEVRSSADPTYLGTATTDADGRFGLEGVPVGTIGVFARDGQTINSHGDGSLTTNGETIDIWVVPVNPVRKP